MSVRATSNDLQALHKLCQGEALKARMLRAASGQALTLNQRGFQTGTDPNDEPWAPLQSRDGMILVRTARMRNSFTSRPTATGFVIGSNVEYTKYHQDGTSGRKQSQTQHRVQPYAGDFLQAGKLGTKRGRFISRKQAAKLQHIAVKSFSMKFAAGSGKIPPRRMVPPNGVLTNKWQQSIDAACGAVMQKAIAEAGGR